VETFLVSGGLTSSAKAVSLDELIALNDEMAALVRAGVPLEQGLVEIGRDMSGRLGRTATEMGERMKAGESLPEILASDERAFPPVWRAVFEAGVRSGDLSSALEGMSTTGRRVAELRRAVGVALVYPIVVLAVAYGLFVLTVTHLAPETLRAYENLTSSSDPFLASIVGLGRTAKWWAIWPPLVVVLLLGIRWCRSGRACMSRGRTERPGRAASSRRTWPTIRQSLRDGRMATFAEILSLLVKQRIPLHEAIVLAADASGDRGLSGAAREIADRQRSGEIIGGQDRIPAPFPPLLGWQVLAGVHQPNLSETLLITADSYRQRAASAAAWASLYLPVVLTVVFGGTATLLQAMVTFGPIIKMLYELAQAA